MRKGQTSESNTDMPSAAELASRAADTADSEDRMIISAIAMHGLLVAGGEWGPDALADAAVKKAEALLARLNRDSQAAGSGA